MDRWKSLGGKVMVLGGDEKVMVHGQVNLNWQITSLLKGLDGKLSRRPDGKFKWTTRWGFAHSKVNAIWEKILISMPPHPCDDRWGRSPESAREGIGQMALLAFLGLGNALIYISTFWGFHIIQILSPTFFAQFPFPAYMHHDMKTKKQGWPRPMVAYDWQGIWCVVFNPTTNNKQLQ